jgi:hypothetical protein
MAGLTGGCLCGAVKYRATKDPIRTAICHCTICQRHIGSAFAMLTAFDRGSVDVVGTLRAYSEPGGTTGKQVDRKFCPTCGTPIIVEVEGSARTLVTTGTLDDKAAIKPAIQIFCESAQPWVPIIAETQNFPGYPA